MANPEHLKILGHGVEVWNRWREKNPQLAPDLKQARLSTTNLWDLNLSGASLQEAVLSGAHLFGTDFTSADLGGADFSRARFIEATLNRADLARVNLCRADLQEVDLTEASLRGADLHYAHFIQADLTSADLSEANLESTELIGATLTMANLAGSNLLRANLSKAELCNAKITRANLSDAQLRGADLRGASLATADLFESDLSGADLTGANLSGAKLCGANLSGADFSEATLFVTVFGNVDLRKVKGLDDVTHNGPSIIGFDTIAKSGGEVSPAFLRGAGLPEGLIEYLPSLFSPKAILFYSCFISYNHGDKSIARRLHDQLQARGIRCWLDEHDLRPGDRMLDVVNDAIRVHDKILLCCSESSLNSWWVKDEIRKAMERERRDGRDIIIPLMVDRYLLDGWEDGLAADLRSRLAADFTGWEHDNTKFEEQFERVVRALRTDDGKRENMPEPRV